MFYNTDDSPKLNERITFAAIRGVFWLLNRLPYRQRVPFTGWLLSRFVSPLAGWNRIIRTNLDYVRPDLSKAEVETLVRTVPNNFGRTLAELFSPDEFLKVARSTILEGPGLAALEEARSVGRRAILVSGHFGNYDVIRASVIARGFSVGGIYRPMRDRQFNELYIKNISKIGTPLFSRGRRGMAEMMRFLKDGGTLAVLIDQRMHNGAPLNFFGKRAYTALSIAELALKYDAIVVPCYGIRQSDGLSFRAVFEAPVPHTTPEKMTQALNDSLEAQVRANMDQWLWFHNRWRGNKAPQVKPKEA